MYKVIDIFTVIGAATVFIALALVIVWAIESISALLNDYRKMKHSMEKREVTSKELYSIYKDISSEIAQWSAKINSIKNQLEHQRRIMEDIKYEIHKKASND